MYFLFEKQITILRISFSTFVIVTFIYSLIEHNFKISKILNILLLSKSKTN